MKRMISTPFPGSSESRWSPDRRGFCLLALFLAVVLASLPASALADPTFKDQIDISITLKSNWDNGYPGSNVREVGSYVVHVSGQAKLAEKDGESLRYVAKNLNASYQLEGRGIMMAKDDECFGKTISKMEASGSVPVTGDGFFVDVKLGETGKFALLQCQGKITSEAIQNLDKMPASDNYNAVLLVPVKITYRRTSDHGCELTNVKTGEGGFSFIIGFRELKPWGMSGSYSWGTEGGARSLEISDCRGDVRYTPEAESGPPRYQVSWVFGEAKPVVRIYWKNKDITDTESEQTIVGKKVKLEARVFPAGYGQPTGKWDIGGKKVSGWDANEKHAKTKLFKDKDNGKPQIEFFWTDGTFGGKPLKVRYSGKVKGKEIEAKAAIQVFKPKIKSESVVPAGMVTIGGMISKKGQVPQCHLYPGNVDISTWPPAASPPGITISYEIQMPPMDNPPPHLLEYAQLIKEDERTNLAGTYWRKHNSKWCHDIHYPYAKKRAPFRLEMDDTPGSDLGQSTRELHDRDKFMTYLLFLPSSNPSDKEAIWVPLRLVEWEWAAGVKKGRDLPLDSPCSAATYRFLYKSPPSVKKKESSPAHPEWSCNISDDKSIIIGVEGFNDDKWNELK